MRHYESGNWGLSLIWGLRASVFPRACAIAVPCGIATYALSFFIKAEKRDEDIAKHLITLISGYTSVLFFVLYFRSNVAYSRWWEGGTLLQQVRGEWFNAYSSLIAFSSTDPKLAEKVERYHHMLSRMMSLLMCAALQQVSPNRDRAFELIDTSSFDANSLEFLSDSPDKVEVILQWIQRSTVLNMSSGILPIPPPVMSRAFQELSRGIVNLQNARKIADFPFPFPYAQTSVLMLMIHWCLCPVLANYLLNPYAAAAASFAVVFFLWCINFIALQLEMPFGDKDNDLPMQLMQHDWNQSVGTLLAYRAQHPPEFVFKPELHRNMEMGMSDGSGPKWYLPLPCNARPSMSEVDSVPRPARSSDSSVRSSNRSGRSSDRSLRTSHGSSLTPESWKIFKKKSPRPSDSTRCPESYCPSTRTSDHTTSGAARRPNSPVGQPASRFTTGEFAPAEARRSEFAPAAGGPAGTSGTCSRVTLGAEVPGGSAEVDPGNSPSRGRPARTTQRRENSPDSENAFDSRSSCTSIASRSRDGTPPPRKALPATQELLEPSSSSSSCDEACAEEKEKINKVTEGRKKKPAKLMPMSTIHSLGSQIFDDDVAADAALPREEGVRKPSKQSTHSNISASIRVVYSGEDVIGVSEEEALASALHRGVGVASSSSTHMKAMSL